MLRIQITSFFKSHWLIFGLGLVLFTSCNKTVVATFSFEIPVPWVIPVGDTGFVSLPAISLPTKIDSICTNNLVDPNRIQKIQLQSVTATLIDTSKNFNDISSFQLMIGSKQLALIPVAACKHTEDGTYQIQNFQIDSLNLLPYFQLDSLYFSANANRSKVVVTPKPFQLQLKFSLKAEITSIK